MFKMCFEVTIGAVKLRGIESISVDSSISLLSDQCTISLPSMAYNKAFDIESKVKRGDPVLVRLGYDDILQDEFKGYLRSIHPNSPMKLECEDAIYLFRKPIASKQFAKTSATVIARYIVDQINKQLPEAQKMRFITDVNTKGFEFDKFTIANANGVQALETLKEQTGYAIYCRGRELHMHLLYTEKRGNVNYDFTRNVEASEGLEYVKAEDIRTRVKIIGRSKKGKKVEAEAGEKGGNEIVIKLPTVIDKNALYKRANAELKKVCYDGYRGAIKGWLLPFCGIGYSAKVLDKDYPEREGIYFINAVKTEFSREGGRRTVSLGIRISVPKPSVAPAPTPAPVIAPATPEVNSLMIEDDGDEEDSEDGVWA